MMNVLGIESSCDETAAAVVRSDGLVLADVVASQDDIHAPYGGVVPELASRAHVRRLVPVVERALADIGPELIDAVAVTQGPGLTGALLTGISLAKAFAFTLEKPLVGVDHLIGHLFACYLRRPGEESSAPALPYVALLVSGGHTALYEVRGAADVRILGQTRDDAAGEAFDKVAKLLGLGYPGGPVIDELAADGDPGAVELPRPMASTRHLDFSFSGLKTAVARHVERDGLPRDPQGLRDLCASFQAVVVDLLVSKSVAACRRLRTPRLVLGGGVAANRGLRRRAIEACAKRGIELSIPPVRSCTDNAAMIAYAGALRLAAGHRDDMTLAAYSRSPDVRRGKFPAARRRARRPAPTE
ncbi:MAG: tRNA (adenosine(37)-N6)-threonylcarbamoyltransferase complex transferase subunit TsaD [Sandaracinaceae bacterium]